MPKFTITTDAGKGPDTHDQSLEFPSTQAATNDAQIALAEMAREALPDGKRADFGVSVTDETGKEVYRAALHFEAQSEKDLESQAVSAVDRDKKHVP